MTNALVGRIVYRLHLPKGSHCTHESSSSLQSKKRKRLECSSALGTQPPDPAQAVAEEEEAEEEVAAAVAQHYPVPIAAWIFQPDDQPEIEFILSVPQCLLALTCDAARLHQTVEILRYLKILLPTSVSVPVSSLPNHYEAQILPTTLVEVYRDGMKVLRSEKENKKGNRLAQHNTDAQKTSTISQSSGSSSTEIRWTLAQLAQQERVDKMQQISSSKRLYSFCGTVDAISPVISMDPTDPFALLELYDPDSTYTCVVVLRKNGLSCQAAISAHDKLILHNVQRQKWRIPAVLAKKLPHLQGRIPSHVFIVGDIHQVTWDPQSQLQSQSQPGTSNDASSDSNVHAPAALSATPSSAPSSLCSLQGSITSVHRIRVGDETHIHYLEVMSSVIDNKEHAGPQLQQRRQILYVTYFPMSSSLQLSLRPGAWIRADNIHPLGRTGWSSEDGWTFGACFRSTVAIVKMASEAVATDDVRKSASGDLSRRPDTIASLESVVPFPLLQIRRSYSEYACRQLLSKWMEDFRVPLSEKTKLPSLQDLSQILMGNNNNMGKSRKNASRNAYGEFFDHGVEYSQAPNNDQEEAGACRMSFHDRCGNLLPLLVCLGQLRDASYDVLKARLHKRLMSSDSLNVQVGWTGSLTLSKDELGQAMDCNFGLQQDGIDGSSEIPMFIGGMTGGTACPGSLQVQLSNGKVVLPVVSTDRRVVSNSAESGFCFAKLACVSISCICIGILSNETTDESSSKVRINPLSLYQRERDAKPSEVGPCSILEIGGRLFMASLSVNCNYFLPMKLHESSSVNQDTDPYCGPNGSADGSSSIQSCLDPSLSSETPPSMFFVGLLTHTVFQLTKTKSGEYNGCTLTVSHDPFDGPDTPSTETVSCIQSIEVKPGIKVEELKRQYLRRCFTNLLGGIVTDDHLTLALVWWKLGSDERTCALLSGGWDQLAPDGSLTAQSIGIMVQIPRSSVQHEAKRGYARFRCRFDDISASLTFLPTGESRSNTTCTIRSASVFDFVSTGRVLPGMLDRRPRRITCHGNQDEEARKRGALVFSPCNPGIPISTLFGLFGAICHDLKSSSRVMVAPSLVREIRGATLMGISYCRAQACCTKCYKTLYEVHVTKGHTNKKNQAWQNGVVESISVADSSNQPTFWDRPLPISYYIQNKQLVPDQNKPPPLAKESPTKRTPQKRSQQTTRLRCPENCSVEHHASIKWECSGTLDDGTGQAKLYADRDTVLVLLGMDTATVEAIEAGAWLDENGIVFSKNFPPKAHIREAVVTARSMAHNQARGRRAGGGQQPAAVQEADVLQFLTPLTRADYLMQQFCRTSKRPTRALNYYVQCKPLSDATKFLSQTQVEIAAPGARGAALTRDVGTYSLPPLKLNLVDCRVVPSDVYQSWDGLQ
jgi:hypothetical protein